MQMVKKLDDPVQVVQDVNVIVWIALMKSMSYLNNNVFSLVSKS